MKTSEKKKCGGKLLGPLDLIQPVFLKKGVNLGEGPAAEEAAVGGKGAGMGGL